MSRIESQDIREGLIAVAKAITPRDSLPWKGPDGQVVGTLTEALIYIGGQLGRIADAIQERDE